MYRNLAVVQQKIYSFLTRFKNVVFHANFLYALRQWGPHHVVCLEAPTILNPPLQSCDNWSNVMSQISSSLLSIFGQVIIALIYGWI